MGAGRRTLRFFFGLVACGLLWLAQSRKLFTVDLIHASLRARVLNCCNTS